MTDIKHRQIRFTFDDDTPFYWNPENPGFSWSSNAISFLIVAFEKYLVKTMNAAMPLIDDPSLLNEAKDLTIQEGHHSMAHLRHARALCAQYPQLEAVLPELEAGWNEMFDALPLKSNLAIVANIELMFTPIAQLLIRDVDTLFGGGDRRVASMFLWHSMEEMEHGAAAITVYNKLYPMGSFHRLMQWREIFRVIKSSQQIIQTHFASIERMSGVDTDLLNQVRQQTRRSRFDELVKLMSIIKSQLPFYDHSKEKLPAFALDWHRREQAGEDMTCYYGAGVDLGAT